MQSPSRLPGSQLEERNRRFLADLFLGKAPHHAIIIVPPRPKPSLGDFQLGAQPVEEWLPWADDQWRRLREYTQSIGDDAVPYVDLNTNTGIFANAFGCEVHVYEGQDTNAAARPIVTNLQEAEALLRQPAPTLNTRMFDRYFAICHACRREFGPEFILNVPDIQSPFDVAAIIWDKADMFVSMLDAPEVVKALIDRTCELIARFLDTFMREFDNINLCHCPYAWAPPSQGMWLSEDEVGSLSLEQFEEFCLPWLEKLSRRFGGMFMHCCANADHQYPGFKKVPTLRGLNRIFQTPGAGPAIRTFSGQTVLIQAWNTVEQYERWMDEAQPNTRFLLNHNVNSIEEAQRAFDRLDRKRRACATR